MIFSSFTPAISPKALKEIGQAVRRWRLHRWTGRGLAGIARQISPVVAGWISCYGRFGRTELHPLLQRISTCLMRWAARKYKRLRAWKRRKKWWLTVVNRGPGLFAHRTLARTSTGYR